MTLREIIGYILLAAFLGVIGWQLLRWRRAVLRERMRRWGTTLSPSQYAKRGRARRHSVK